MRTKRQKRKEKTILYHEQKTRAKIENKQHTHRQTINTKLHLDSRSHISWYRQLIEISLKPSHMYTSRSP